MQMGDLPNQSRLPKNYLSRNYRVIKISNAFIWWCHWSRCISIVDLYVLLGLVFYCSHVWKDHHLQAYTICHQLVFDKSIFNEQRKPCWCCEQIIDIFETTLHQHYCSLLFYISSWNKSIWNAEKTWKN